MRVIYAITTCLLMAGTLPALAAVSQQDAVERVQSAGYRLVSKAEPTSGGASWDVWASKDGIPYEVKVDATDGSLIEAVPLQAND